MDDYLLSRDAAESKRLNEQHQLYVNVFGHLLHPRIVAKLPASPRIADVGTGTGVVLKDLAPSLPTATFDGFDVSRAQLLAQDQLPKNFEFHLVNCKEPFPADLHGKFDVVYLRLLVTAMEPPHDWEVVTKNAVELLRPGGALQWTDASFGQMLPVLRERPDATVDGLTELCELAFGLVRNRIDYDFRQLKTVFEQSGLANVQHDAVSSDVDSSTRLFGTLLEIGACYGALRASSNISAVDLDRIRAQALKDAESGAYVRWNIHQITGFKPA